MALLSVAPSAAWAGTGAVSGSVLPVVPLLLVMGGLGFAVWRAWCVRRVLREETQALRGELARSASVLASAPLTHFLWRSDGSEACSPALARWLGAGDEGIDSFARLTVLLAPDACAALIDAVADLRRRDNAFSLTVRAAHGPHTFAVHGVRTGSPEEGAVTHVLYFSDVTGHLEEIERLTERASAAIRERDGLREILDAIPMPIGWRGEDLSLRWCNRNYASAVESTPEEAVATPGIELASSVNKAQALDLAKRAQNKGESQSEIRRVVIDGERRSLEVVEIPLESGGGVGFARDVTALAEARRELDDFIKAHEDVLENLPTPVAIFGRDKYLKLFNSAYAKLWKLDEVWLANQPSHGEILEVLRERRQLPEQADFPAYKKGRLDLYTSLIEPQEEIHHLPDGTTLRGRVSPHPLGGLLEFFEDITDRLELERAWHTLVAVQKATLDNLHEGVAVFGADGRLKLYNANFATIWRHTDEQLSDEPHIGELIESSKDLFDYGTDWESFKTTVVARVTDREPRNIRYERPDGSVIVHTAEPLPDGNMLYTYLDVTDTVRIERALRERNEALETADRLKTEFIANVSYELRTPLNTIIGFADILTNAYFGTLNERQKEYSDGILRSSYRLLDLINDILDLATIEAGRMILDLDTFDLRAALSSVLPLTRERVFSRDLTVEFNCSEDLGLIEADERRIKQVVFNMMSNAMKFTAPGGTITLAAEREGDWIELSVSDTGEGIPADEQAMVFENFYKGASSRHQKPGIGLGLSLVRSFVELHGGQVDLESGPDRGTRVICRFPTRLSTPTHRVVAAGD